MQSLQGEEKGTGAWIAGWEVGQNNICSEVCRIVCMTHPIYTIPLSGTNCTQNKAYVLNTLSNLDVIKTQAIKELKTRSA